MIMNQDIHKFSATFGVMIGYSKIVKGCSDRPLASELYSNLR